MSSKVLLRATDSGKEQFFEYGHALRILRNTERQNNPSARWEIAGKHEFRDGQIKLKISADRKRNPGASKRTKKP